EVMYCPRTEAATSVETFDAVAIGPGLGVDYPQMQSMLTTPATPIVVDADALTFLSENQDILSEIPPRSILTPHMKEFDRLFGPHSSWWDRVQTARKQATALKLIIILKNRYTFIALPDGNVAINPSGNPAMASGGVGDVVNGVLVSCFASG